MPLLPVVTLTARTAHIIFTCIGPSHYGQHVMGMLDCAPLIIVSVVCLTMQAPVAQWLRHWSRKPEVPGSIPGQAHFSFSLP